MAEKESRNPVQKGEDGEMKEEVCQGEQVHSFEARATGFFL